MKKGRNFVLTLGVLAALAGIYLLFSGDTAIGLGGLISALGLIYIATAKTNETQSED